MELFSIRIRRTFQLVSTIHPHGAFRMAQIHMIMCRIASARFQKSLYVIGEGGKLEIIHKTAEAAPDEL